MVSTDNEDAYEPFDWKAHDREFEQRMNALKPWYEKLPEEERKRVDEWVKLHQEMCVPRAG